MASTAATVRDGMGFRDRDNELRSVSRPAGFRGFRCPGPFMDYLLTMKQEYKHGEFFNYSAANAGVLQLILERTTRTSYFEHLSEHWRNLGAERCATLMIDHAGCAASQSGMACTVRDWARWGQMLCSGGRVGCGRVLPGIADLVSDIQRNPGPERWDEDTRKGSLPGMGYRSHLFTMPARPGDPPILASVGGYQQHCLIDPLRKNVVVQVASLADWSVVAHAQAALQCFMVLQRTVPLGREYT
jgi:6-aminohexanoate-oligomer exohydrolase